MVVREVRDFIKDNPKKSAGFGAALVAIGALAIDGAINATEFTIGEFFHHPTPGATVNNINITIPGQNNTAGNNTNSTPQHDVNATLPGNINLTNGNATHQLNATEYQALPGVYNSILKENISLQDIQRYNQTPMAIKNVTHLREIRAQIGNDSFDPVILSAQFDQFTDGIYNNTTEPHNREISQLIFWVDGGHGYKQTLFQNESGFNPKAPKEIPYDLAVAIMRSKEKLYGTA